MGVKKNKTNKRNAKKNENGLQFYVREAKALFLFTFSLLLFIALFSFSIHSENKHLLGSIGFSISKLIHGLFGILSFLIALFFIWISISELLNFKNESLKKQSIHFALFISSLCILLSVIEETSPALRYSIRHFFYPESSLKGFNYHLGGAFFYYLYQDIPRINLATLLNSSGTFILFSFVMLFALAELFSINLFLLLSKGLAYGLTRLIAFTKKFKMPDFKNFKIEPILAKESAFKNEERHVMLKTSPGQEMDSRKNPKDSLETLLIQPEKHLQERPSLSRKSFGEEISENPFSKFNSRTDQQDLFPADLEKPALGPQMPQYPLEVSKKKENAAIKKSIESKISELKSKNTSLVNYKLPSNSLLTVPQKVDQSQLRKDLKKQAEVLEETLQSFGIEAKVGQINCGPTINSFEVHPSIGVKVQRIKALESDIALNMEAKSIRIIAPIPGKAAVGIEIPNPLPQEVSFREMLQAYQSQSKKFAIPILLGKSVSGEWVMSDLAKMPHCIIAGATGSGKSVCINTIVMSILLNCRPDEVKLIMVDPKKVELTAYSPLPHMLAPVINEPIGAMAALKWLVKEMESRYEMLKLLGLRNILAFNGRVIDEEKEKELGKEIPKTMPYIVGIIDELADLMMVASQDIETPIARIAQMARAVGIHLILATQRPSREVITGLIKANFPTRISFKVASRVNSQIILDEIGAESLLGNGDMLFLPPGTSNLLRAQGAYIRDEDINKVIKFISEQAAPEYVIESFDSMPFDDGGMDEEIDEPADSLYHEAKEIVLKTGNASTTFLQRKLKIGYARAASLMDALEKNGIVGPQEGSKPRKILASSASSQPALDPNIDDLDDDF